MQKCICRQNTAISSFEHCVRVCTCLCSFFVGEVVHVWCWSIVKGMKPHNTIWLVTLASNGTRGDMKLYQSITYALCKMGISIIIYMLLPYWLVKTELSLFLLKKLAILDNLGNCHHIKAVKTETFLLAYWYWLRTPIKLKFLLHYHYWLEFI